MKNERETRILRLYERGKYCINGKKSFGGNILIREMSENEKKCELIENIILKTYKREFGESTRKLEEVWKNP